MKNNLSLFSSVNKINHHHSFDYYIKEEKIDTTFNIESNSSLIINLVDFNNINSNINIIFNLKSNSQIIFNLITLASKLDNKKYNILINHNSGDSFSKVNMSGINLGGKIIIDASATINKGAIKSDTRIEGKITNLSSSAISKVSPMLFIKENDVKASHSASLGSYNQSDLFYLTSRGLTINDAKKAITYGSIYPLINNINDSSIKTISLEKIRSLSI